MDQIQVVSMRRMLLNAVFFRPGACILEWSEPAFDWIFGVRQCSEYL